MQQVTMGKVRMVWRLFLFASMLLVYFPVCYLSLRLSEENRSRVIRFMLRIVMWGLGYHITVYGKPVDDRPCIYVSNHISYLDIPVLGSVLKASFVSRGDVANWPVFGILGKLQRTVFIERKPELARQHANTLRERIEAGDRLLFFPEGTSNDGMRMLPIKSSLFDVAKPIQHTDGREEQVTVQPISLIVTEIGHLPIGRHQRPLYAWYGDMDFFPHFLEALQQPSFTLEVQFHAPVTMAQFANRKGLAAHCEHVMQEGLSRGLSGRPVYDTALIPTPHHDPSAVNA